MFKIWLRLTRISIEFFIKLKKFPTKNRVPKFSTHFHWCQTLRTKEGGATESRHRSTARNNIRRRRRPCRKTLGICFLRFARRTESRCGPERKADWFVIEPFPAPVGSSDAVEQGGCTCMMCSLVNLLLPGFLGDVSIIWLKCNYKIGHVDWQILQVVLAWFFPMNLVVYTWMSLLVLEQKWRQETNIKLSS